MNKTLLIFNIIICIKDNSFFISQSMINITKIILIVGFIIPLLASQRLRNLQNESEDTSSFLIGVVIFAILLLVAFCYEKRNGFKWTTLIRHQIGDIFYKIRAYRKKKVDKQQRI